MSRRTAFMALVLFASILALIGCMLARPVFRELESYPKPPKATTRHVDTFDASTGSLMLKGVKRWVAGADNHGNKGDPNAQRVFFEFAKFWKPDIRIHLGDCFDFSALRKAASDQEKREPIREDVDAGIEFIKKYQPTHFLRGNHDERLWDAFQSDDGKLADFASSLIDDITESLGDAQTFPYDKRKGLLRLGKLKGIHGYNSGITAARMAAQIYGSVMMGHIHAIDQFSIPGIERRIGRAIGCLCLLDQNYNRAQANTLRQGHGFAYGLLYPSGDYVFWQAEEVAKKWHFPSEVTVL